MDSVAVISRIAWCLNTNVASPFESEKSVCSWSWEVLVASEEKSLMVAPETGTPAVSTTVITAVQSVSFLHEVEPRANPNAIAASIGNAAFLKDRFFIITLIFSNIAGQVNSRQYYKYYCYVISKYIKFLQI